MYDVKTEQAKDQKSWGAWCEDLPVSVCGGTTKQEALAFLQEAIELHLEWARNQASRHLQAA